MKWLIAILFTVVCRPGTIYEIDESSTDLVGNNPASYYYYDLEYEPGAYLYVSSDRKDSAWFYVEDSVYYLYPKDSEVFEVQN